MFSGDLLFAGSIGRTDLPGGDYPTILRSLAAKCLPLPDEHGGPARATDHRPRSAASAPPILISKEAAPHAGPTEGI